MTKTVKSASGTFKLETPRDRNGTFELQIVKKRQTILTAELDNKILSLYVLGTSYDDISKHLSDIYGVDVAAATISAVTDKLMPMIGEWKVRTLDAMFFKVKQDHKVQTKILYNIMGINHQGRKEILSFYTCESQGGAFLAWSLK
jgi:putative transposase